MKWYVYELVDPIAGRPFYIGKGCGRRMRSHLGASAAPHVRSAVRRLRRLGVEPIAREVAYFWDEQDALRHEAELIQSASGLVNIFKNPARPKCYTLFETVCNAVLGRIHKVELERRLHMFSQAIDYVADDCHREQYRQLVSVGYASLR